jgi:hypothetical protein
MAHNRWYCRWGEGGRGFTAPLRTSRTFVVKVTVKKNSKRTDMQTAFTDVEKNVNCTQWWPRNSTTYSALCYKMGNASQRYCSTQRLDVSSIHSFIHSFTHTAFKCSVNCCWSPLPTVLTFVYVLILAYFARHFYKRQTNSILSFDGTIIIKSACEKNVCPYAK